MTSPVATAIALASLAVVVSAVAYMILASVQRLWPFPPDDDEDEPLTIWYTQEDDGRWIAEAVGRPGAVVYGSTVEDARRNLLALVAELDGTVALDAWSGVDPRHGDDGNSGHG